MNQCTHKDAGKTTVSRRHLSRTQWTLLSLLLLLHPKNSENTVYLCGSGAGFNPGAELVLCDLAVVVPAVEQAKRHRVLLPDEPGWITKRLQARQSASCTERKTPIPLPASPSLREVTQRHIHREHCYLRYRLVPFHLITWNSYRLHAYFGVDDEAAEARIKKIINTGLLLMVIVFEINKWNLKKASITILGSRAALVTDARQSIEAQKGNPPSRAHHQHHHVSPFSWKRQNNAVFQEQALGVLPSLEKPEAGTGSLVSAVLLIGGHRGLYESKRRARLSAQRPRGAAARRK